MFGTSLAFWSPPQDEAVPLSILSSGIAGTNTEGGTTDPISDSITVPADTTLLVVVMGVLDNDIATQFDNVQFNGDAMVENIPMDVAATATQPGLQFWTLKNPDIGTFNLTGDRSTACNCDLRLFVCIGGDLHETVHISDTDAPAVDPNNTTPRSSTVDVAADGSLVISAVIGQGADTDPFAASGILNTTELQTGDTLGGSTTGDAGYGLAWGAVDAGNGQTYTWTPTSADGGQIAAIVIRPAA